jgi:GNAT superfamily N-acetyltransferase
MAIEIRRLGESNRTDEFDCGDEALNRYLHLHAWQNQQKRLIGVTYVAAEESASQMPLGYFTLANASAPFRQFPKKIVRGLPAYDLPLLLLARLAVDRRFAGQSLGRILLGEACRIATLIAAESGCRGVITDAYREKIAWYARFGFIPLEEETESRTVRMFLDMRTIRAVL